eukprot:1149900-Pelagomonas_calceolata.AAC.10
MKCVTYVTSIVAIKVSIVDSCMRNYALDSPIRATAAPLLGTPGTLPLGIVAFLINVSSASMEIWDGPTPISAAQALMGACRNRGDAGASKLSANCKDLSTAALHVTRSSLQ